MTPERIAKLRGQTDPQTHWIAPCDLRECLDEIERLRADYDRELSKSAALTRVMREVAENLREKSIGWGWDLKAWMQGTADRLESARAATYGKAETEYAMRRCLAVHTGERCVLYEGHAGWHKTPGNVCITWPEPEQEERSTEVKQPGRCNATSSEGRPCTLQAGHARYYEHCPEGGTEWRTAWWDDAGGKPHQPGPDKIAEERIKAYNAGRASRDDLVKAQSEKIKEQRDTIAHLTKERDEARAETTAAESCADLQRARAKAAERQAEQLRAALREVAAIAGGWIPDPLAPSNAAAAHRARVNHLLEVCGVK